jgi:hypothetical protein
VYLLTYSLNGTSAYYKANIKTPIKFKKTIRTQKTTKTKAKFQGERNIKEVLGEKP